MLSLFSATSAFAEIQNIGQDSSSYVVEKSTFANFDYGQMLKNEEVSNLTIEKSQYETKYVCTFNGKTQSEIIEEIGLDGSRVYNITEGSLSDIVVFQKNGEILLNGRKVTSQIFSEIPQVGIDTLEGTIAPQGRHYNKTTYVSECPYGTESDYSDYVEHLEYDVEFRELVKNLTIGAIVTIITGGLAYLAELGALAGTVLSIGTGSATTVANYLKSNSPLAIGSKIQLYRYQHAKYGHCIPRSEPGESRYVYKDRLYYYSKDSNNNYKYMWTDIQYLLTRIMG